MNTSPVYFTDFRCRPGLNQQQKLRKLLLKAGMDKIDFQDKFVAIKMHFGELGNLAFLRPNYAKTVADLVKELGGRPFLTDCNTLYVGSRSSISIPPIPTASPRSPRAATSSLPTA